MCCCCFSLHFLCWPDSIEQKLWTFEIIQHKNQRSQSEWEREWVIVWVCACTCACVRVCARESVREIERDRLTSWLRWTMQIMSEWNWIETKRGKNLRPELDFWTNLKFIFIILFDFVRKFSGSIFWSKNHSEAFLGFDEPAANFLQSWENLKLQQLSQFLAASCQVSKNAACLGKYIFLNDLLSECADTK